MHRILFLAALLAAYASVPALANPVDNSPNISVTAKSGAEIRDRETAARWTPNDGASFTDLGLAYLRAGRPADAETAYRRALELDNVVLTTVTGEDVWSHEVARRALSRHFTISSR